MKIKLKDGQEIGMYFEGKQRNLSDQEIQRSIEILREIRGLK